LFQKVSNGACCDTGNSCGKVIVTVKRKKGWKVERERETTIIFIDERRNEARKGRGVL